MRFLPYREAYSATRVGSLLRLFSAAVSTLTEASLGGNDRGHRSAQHGEADLGVGTASEPVTRRVRARARRAPHCDSSQRQRVARITTTARRIAHAHNCCGPALSGGLLAFDSEGRGGTWHSGRFRPPAAIVYPVSHGRVSARDVQAWLDTQEASK